MTNRGRTIHYEQGALDVDDQGLMLPCELRAVAFDGANVYVDGRRIEAS